MKRQVRHKGAHMRIAGEMTVYTAAALQTKVLEGIAKHSAVKLLDLSEVSDIDTAGLQILLAARRFAVTQGRPLQIVAVSPAVSEVLGLLQLTSLVAVPAADTKP
jgi:anti-sigma B factor antagonist